MGGRFKINCSHHAHRSKGIMSMVLLTDVFLIVFWMKVELCGPVEFAYTDNIY